MAANTFGTHFRVTTFGESHGAALGAVIDGCPSGVVFDSSLIQQELLRRRPGSISMNSAGIVSSRDERDQLELLSGVFDGRTLGTPIAMMVRNTDQRSSDYEAIKESPRQGHADDTWKNKFSHIDHRGGGRSSGRETLGRVLGGAVAKMFVQQVAPLCEVMGMSAQIGPLRLTEEEYGFIQSGLYRPDDFTARFPSPRHEQVKDLLIQARAMGESYGGIAELWIKNPPPRLGQPVFSKFKATLADGMMGIGATVGFEFGSGFESASQLGSQFHKAQEEGANQEQYGGIRGGITTGEMIRLRVAFKPTSSILETAKQGRHDPCIVVRAIPVIEAMAWMTIADHLLWARHDRV